LAGDDEYWKRPTQTACIVITLHATLDGLAARMTASPVAMTTIVSCFKTTNIDGRMNCKLYVSSSVVDVMNPA